MEAYGNVRTLLPRLAGEEPAGEIMVGGSPPPRLGWLFAADARARAKACGTLPALKGLEKSLDNCCPVDATGRHLTMRAAGSAAAGPAGAKAAPQPKITNQQPSDDDLHEEYAWAWVLHNLVPFADKLLGIAGRALRRNQLQRCTPSTRCWPHDCVCSIV